MDTLRRSWPSQVVIKASVDPKMVHEMSSSRVFNSPHAPPRPSIASALQDAQQHLRPRPPPDAAHSNGVALRPHTAETWTSPHLPRLAAAPRHPPVDLRSPSASVTPAALRPSPAPALSPASPATELVGRGSKASARSAGRGSKSSTPAGRGSRTNVLSAADRRLDNPPSALSTDPGAGGRADAPARSPSSDGAGRFTQTRLPASRRPDDCSGEFALADPLLQEECEEHVRYQRSLMRHHLLEDQLWVRQQRELRGLPGAAPATSALLHHDVL